MPGKDCEVRCKYQRQYLPIGISNIPLFNWREQQKPQCSPNHRHFMLIR